VRKEPGCRAKKPCDLLAAGLSVSSSRGDKTPLELFLGGVASWDAIMRRRMDDGKPCSE
jgi:hypothetical protein